MEAQTVAKLEGQIGFGLNSTRLASQVLFKPLRGICYGHSPPLPKNLL